MTAQPVVTVLVVDDNAMTRRVAVRAFQTLGCAVMEAEDAQGAWVQLTAHPDITLLFADLHMPGMNGVELAAKARALRPGLRIALTSGNPGEAVLRGDLSFVRKPWRMADLKPLLPPAACGDVRA